MPWDRSQPADPKYRGKAHRDYRAGLVAQLKRDGYLMCTADVWHGSRLTRLAECRTRRM